MISRLWSRETLLRLLSGSTQPTRTKVLPFDSELQDILVYTGSFSIYNSQAIL